MELRRRPEYSACDPARMAGELEDFDPVATKRFRFKRIGYGA
jgi:hypothetical protein